MSRGNTAPAVLGRRACAVLAVVSAGLHGLMVGQGGNVVVAGIVLAMMAACLYCARELWAANSERAWCLVALMNLGMIAIHWSIPGCHPGATSAAVLPSTLMLAASAVAAVEVVIATVVLSVMTRGRAAALCLGRGEPA